MSAELPTLLEDARALLQGAAQEPHDPATDMVIDALAAVIDHLDAPCEPDRESILTDPKAIAARHEVNVTWLLNRIEVTTGGGDGVLLGRNEALFVLDLLAALGVE